MIKILQLSFILTVLCSATVTAAQHYILDGPTTIYCDDRPQTYTIDTDEQIGITFWEIIPSTGAQFLSSGNLTATIQFQNSGFYTLISSSIGLNGTELYDTLFIIVQLSTFQFEIGGCYINNPGSSACYQVCAHSVITIYSQQIQNGEVFVTGADSYSTDYDTYIEVTWGAGGFGEVIFYNGCENKICFEIFSNPVADFTTSPVSLTDTLTICKGQEIFFENTSVDGLTYLWKFGDGNQSTTFDASHTYTEEGFYTVTLSAESICSCADEKQIVVEVLPSPAPSLDCVNSVCPESRQRYTATTNGCSQFYWTVSSNGTIVNGGGVNDDFIEVVWHEGPDGTIELSVDGCAEQYCPSVNTFRIPIITPDGPITGDASVCTGEIVTYEAPYFPGTTYNWQIGGFGAIISGGTSNALTVHWDDVSLVTPTSVSVQYENCFLECGGEDVLPVRITPEFRIQGDVQVCQDGTAGVSATAGFTTPVAANVEWHLENDMGQTVFSQPGPTNLFVHTFSYPPGTYEWVATNASTSYCNTEVRLKIQVTATPTAPLGISGQNIVCSGILYGFTIDPSGVYATIWTITDGASTHTYFGQTCDHVFGNTPPYVVSAHHADIQFPDCVSDPVSFSLQSINSFSVQGPAEACFNAIDSYSFAEVNGADYRWEVIPSDFGEIRRSNLHEVELFWTRPGNATVRLQSCGNVFDKAVTIHPSPAFNLVGPTAACQNELVNITTDQPIYTHHWFDENENFISNMTSVNLRPGAYGVQLTDAYGCKNNKTFDITSYPAPVVNLSTAADNLYCNLIPVGVEIVANTDGAGYTHVWYKDDVNIGPGGPIFNVTDFGEYHVEVTNQYGCKAVSTKIKFEDCCPPMNCSLILSGIPGGCTYIPYDFDILKSYVSCNEVEYLPQIAGLEPGSSSWLIYKAGDGFIANIPIDILRYEYALPGYYKLIMLSRITGFPYPAGSCGHYEIITDTIRAVADFKHQGYCQSAPIVFEDLTTFLPNETIASWSWDFGDPGSGSSNVSSLQDPGHTFSTSGTFEVTLSVTLASGCSTTKKISVQVSGGPVLMPVYEPVYCEDEAYAFSIPGGVFDMTWDFGDPSSGIQNQASVADAFHTYDNPGIFNVTIDAADVYGCRSQLLFPVETKPNTLSGTIAVDPATTICFGDTATLTAPLGGQYWSWTNNTNTPFIDVASSDQYGVLIQDQYFCSYVPPTVFISVLPKPEIIIRAREILGPGEYGPWDSTLQVCHGTEFEIQAFSSEFLTWQWVHGPVTDVIQFTDEGANLPVPGLYQFHVYGVNAFGCFSDTASITIEIFELPNISGLTLQSGSGCAFDDNVISVLFPEADLIYIWSDGQQGESITVQAEGEYFVTAYNIHGCSRKSNSILILPASAVDQIPGGCFIKCDPLTVCLPSLSNIASYNLYRNGVLIQSGTTWPADYLITAYGSYVFEVTSTNGCTATSDPLDVVLFTGVGSITVLTYLDTDGNGVISAGDVLLPNIPVQIVSDDGMHAGATETGSDGGFVFEDYPALGYTALFDRLLLPSQYQIVIDSVATTITTCGDSVVVSLLLEQNCTVSGPDQDFQLCPGDDLMVGDSVWSDTGTYIMHMLSAFGCDSVFNVVIGLPDSIEIQVTVWVDVDHNGIISPADTVIQGITIIHDHQISQGPIIDVTDQNGTVSGMYDAGWWTIAVDSTILPSGLEVIYGLDQIGDTICGMITFDFLLGPSCSDLYIIADAILCPGDSVLVEGQWLTEAGSYTFVLNEPGSGCDTTLDVGIEVWPGITYEVMSAWSCDSLGTIELQISGIDPFAIDWSHPGEGGTLLEGIDAGEYFYLITDGNGCSVYDSVEVIESPLFNFQLDDLYELNSGDSVLVSVTGDINEPGLNFQWNLHTILSCDTCPSTYVTPLWDTLLAVTIVDANGCVYELGTTILLSDDSTIVDRIYVPNVFTPDGDGINDHWRIFSRMDNAYVHELTLFDRWGKMVFYKNDFVLNTFTGWDGTFKGKPLNPNVFVYMAELTLGDGTRTRVRGDVTLVR